MEEHAAGFGVGPNERACVQLGRAAMSQRRESWVAENKGTKKTIVHVSLGSSWFGLIGRKAARCRSTHPGTQHPPILATRRPSWVPANMKMLTKLGLTKPGREKTIWPMSGVLERGRA